MKSAASFITQLVSVSREVEPLVPIVNTHGETLFMQVSLEHVLDFVYFIIRAANDPLVFSFHNNGEDPYLVESAY